MPSLFNAQSQEIIPPDLKTLDFSPAQSAQSIPNFTNTQPCLRKRPASIPDDPPPQKKFDLTIIGSPKVNFSYSRKSDASCSNGQMISVELLFKSKEFYDALAPLFQDNAYKLIEWNPEAALLLLICAFITRDENSLTKNIDINGLEKRCNQEVLTPVSIQELQLKIASAAFAQLNITSKELRESIYYNQLATQWHIGLPNPSLENSRTWKRLVNCLQKICTRTKELKERRIIGRSPSMSDKESTNSYPSWQQNPCVPQKFLQSSLKLSVTRILKSTCAATKIVRCLRKHAIFIAALQPKNALILHICELSIKGFFLLPSENVDINDLESRCLGPLTYESIKKLHQEVASATLFCTGLNREQILDNVFFQDGKWYKKAELGVASFNKEKADQLAKCLLLLHKEEANLKIPLYFTSSPTL
jgi:hypothetical protein